MELRCRVLVFGDRVQVFACSEEACRRSNRGWNKVGALEASVKGQDIRSYPVIAPRYRFAPRCFFIDLLRSSCAWDKRDCAKTRHPQGRVASSPSLLLLRTNGLFIDRLRSSCAWLDWSMKKPSHFVARLSLGGEGGIARSGPSQKRSGFKVNPVIASR